MIPAGSVFHKPKGFIAAENILYASVFVAALSVSIRDLTLGIAYNGGIPVLLLTAAIYLFIIFLVKQMSFCKKWARTILLILYISMPLIIIRDFRSGSQVGIVEKGVFIFQVGLQLIALILLYQKECNSWFNNRVA